MAIDKLVDSSQLDNNLTLVANAIRTKSGTTTNLAFPTDFITAINAISGGGGSVTWETMADQTCTITTYDGMRIITINGYDEPLSADETYRITWGDTQYICNTIVDPVGFTQDGYYIGNAGVFGSQYEDTGEPFALYRTSSSRLIGATEDTASSVYVKIERQTTSSASLITKTISANGTYNASSDNADGYSQVTVNVPTGSGGLTFETGTYEPTADTSGEKILFANSHSEAPAFIMMVDATGTTDTTANTNMQFVWYDYYKLYGIGIPWSSSAYRYATAFYVYRASSTTALTQGSVQCAYNSDNAGSGGINYPRFWADELGFTPNSASTSRYWRAGRTYKWYAIWK